MVDAGRPSSRPIPRRGPGLLQVPDLLPLVQVQEPLPSEFFPLNGRGFCVRFLVISRQLNRTSRTRRDLLSGGDGLVPRIAAGDSDTLPSGFEDSEAFGSQLMVEFPARMRIRTPAGRTSILSVMAGHRATVTCGICSSEATIRVETPWSIRSSTVRRSSSLYFRYGPEGSADSVPLQLLKIRPLQPQLDPARHLAPSQVTSSAAAASSGVGSDFFFGGLTSFSVPLITAPSPVSF